MLRFCILLCLLAACQPDIVLPTVMELDAVATEVSAATATAQTGATARAATRALPPTWTPLPTEPPTEVLAVTPSPERAVGTIYYIYQENTIMALQDNGLDALNEAPLVESASPISELALSPDGTQLAYVSGDTVQEVYLVGQNGNSTQLTNVRLARVFGLAWRADGQAIAFIGSPTMQGNVEVYVVAPAGGGAQQVSQISSPSLQSVAWNTTGDTLYFDNNALYALHLPTRAVYQLTRPFSFGPDFNPLTEPESGELYYLKTRYDDVNGVFGGAIYSVDVSRLDEPGEERRGGEFYAQQIRWSSTGDYLLIASNESVWVQDRAFGTSRQVLDETAFPPQPVFSPDDARIAFIDGGEDDPTVPQVFVIDRNGNNRTQLTRHVTGTISDLAWGES